MKKSRLLLAALPLILLAACTVKDPEPTLPPLPTPTPAPVVTVTPTPESPVWQDQVFEKEYSNDEGVKLLSARFVLPGIVEAGANPAWTAINDYYKAEGEGYMATADETADQADGDYDIQLSLGYDFSPYALESYYSVTYQSASVISVRRTYYFDMDAAYPTTFQFSEQFDAVTGDKLSLGDFFSDPDAAKAQVLEAIRAQIAKRDDADGFDLTRVESSFNEAYFYLTQDSVVFYYQSDDIAPHAAGIPEFPIPRTDFGELLTR